MWRALVPVLSIALFVPHAARAGDAPTVWAGVNYGSPLRLSGEATTFLGLDHDPFWGLVGTASAGIGGAKIGVGVFALGDMLPRSGPSYEPWPGIWHGVAVKAVLVRTWGAPLGAETNRTLVGGEIEYSVLSALNVHVGVLAPIGGASSDGAHILTWGVGLRLPIE